MSLLVDCHMHIIEPDWNPNKRFQWDGRQLGASGAVVRAPRIRSRVLPARLGDISGRRRWIGRWRGWIRRGWMCR